MNKIKVSNAKRIAARLAIQRYPSAICPPLNPEYICANVVSVSLGIFCGSPHFFELRRLF